MKQSQGFVDLKFSSHVCKLQKSLYGLKKAPRAWNERFSSYILVIGFAKTYADHSLFIRSYKGSITILPLYVDDLIIIGNDLGYITHLIAQLNFLFEMKNLGRLHHFLGIKVNRTCTGLFLSQTKYAKDLLSKMSMLGC